jgi:hypothetical protein
LSRKRSGSFAPELLPGEPLEQGGELLVHSGALGQRPEHQEEEDRDREHREAEDPAAIPLLEGEGREQRVEELSPGDDRKRDPTEDRQEHRPV